MASVSHSSGKQDSADQPTVVGAHLPATQAPIPSMRSAGVCSNCGAVMSADQRYCVECGTRRGKPRFTLANQMSPMTAAADGAGAASGSGKASGHSWSSGAGYVMTVAILLLALGVGVLIGHQGGSGASAQRPVNVTVKGGAGSGAVASAPATTTPATSTAASSSGSSKSAAASSGTSTTVVHLSQKSQQAINKASGTTKNKAKEVAPTAKVGSSCTQGQAGCGKNGKFNGDFFSGQ